MAAIVVTSQSPGTPNSSATAARSKARNWRTDNPRAWAWNVMCATACPRVVAAALADGATPVLVEGPLDALAVTLAGDGQFVGIAPLGVAFTDAQADRLRPLIRADRPQVIVATDADRAGQLAAERIFWQLTERGADPRHLVVPSGKDPAGLLETAGTDALLRALADSPSMASAVIDARIDGTAPGSCRSPRPLRTSSRTCGAPRKWNDNTPALRGTRLDTCSPRRPANPATRATPFAPSRSQPHEPVYPTPDSTPCGTPQPASCSATASG
jgi:5S rRNA maturation endonuclease (ribonuclease M5)